MEKLISFTIPCYNSAAYMRHAVDSILVGGEAVEIIIIDDGSTDDTLKIAKKYQKTYPTICSVIHQENLGHGEGINQGLKHAKGLYYKVIDSDDWVDKQSLLKVLTFIKKLVKQNHIIDLILVNYVYENSKTDSERIVKLTNVFKSNEITTFETAGLFKPGQYLMMHSLIYRTRLLIDMEFELPKHTFYEDSLVVYYPLPYVKELCYLNVDFYRYFIGRADQSVNADVFITRIDQHIKVTKLMIDYYDLREIKKTQPRVFKYLYRHLLQNMLVASIFLTMYDTKENLAKRDELWSYLKRKMPILYTRFRFHVFGIVSNLKGTNVQNTVKTLYDVTQRFLKSN